MRSNLALLARRRHSQGSQVQGARGDRAPQGWYLGPAHAAGTSVHPRPPTPAPCRSLRGPLRCLGFPPRAVAGYRYYPPPVPTQSHTHPVYPPGTPSRVQCSLHVHSARYSRSGTHVGEPRGIRTQPLSGSHGCFILYLRFTRPFDWV